MKYQKVKLLHIGVRERKAAILLFCLYLIIQYTAIIFPADYSSLIQDSPPCLMDSNSIQDVSETLTITDSTPIKKKEPLQRPILISKYYAIDTMEVNDWIDLGMDNKIAYRISNYLSKGGQINRHADLYKIYGIDSSLLNNLKGRILFPKPVEKKQKAININVATQEELQILRGIGPKLSARIIKYRKRLGGFYEKEQLLEVYGIENEVLENNTSLIICSGSLDSILINMVSYDSLVRHYYFGPDLTRRIINYRQAHGYFTNAQDIKGMHAVDDSIFNKILPYLSFSM